MGAFDGQVSSSSANIYTSNGVIADALRTVEINTELRFDHGLAGANGRVQMIYGGYFKNSVAPAVSTNTYFEYNHNDGKFTTRSDIHTVTGFKATRIGTVGNPTADVELYAGSNGDCYMNFAATTNRYFVFDNGNITQAHYPSSGTWSIGNGFPDHSVGLTVYGKGGTVATRSQEWKNSSGTLLMGVYDNGYIKLHLLPTYADDAAAGVGGLTTGFIYKTATGELRIKL